jgi:hypothetical protein
LHAGADDPPGELAHDDQNPVGTKQDRFGPEQVQTPEAVVGVTKNRQPRRPARPPLGAVGPVQDAADDIFIDFQGKGLVEMLSNFGTAKP